MRRKFGEYVLTVVALVAGLVFLSRPAFSQATQCIANVAAQGTGDAITSAALPCGTTTNMVILTASAPNVTTTPTYQPIGSPALPITRAGGGPLVTGDLTTGYVALLTSTGSSWVLINPATLGAGGNSPILTPLDFGCVGNGVANDTACLQGAITSASAAGLPLFFDGAHLYLVTGELDVTGKTDLEGFAPVGNDGISNAQVCPWGIINHSNTNGLVVTAEKVIIHNLCLDMASPGVSATAGVAIDLGGTDQQSTVIEGNTIFRPYDGIDICGPSGSLVRDTVINNNTVRSPGRYGVSNGLGTTGGACVGNAFYNNPIGCDTFDPNGIGFALFDGAITFNGTDVGPSNCLINTEIVPGAAQNVNGSFYGVVGDAAGRHGGTPYELYIQPSSSSGTIQWLEFSNIWTGSVEPGDTDIYIGNANGGACSNIKFNGPTVHSGVNLNGPANVMVNIQGCDNIVVAGGTFDAWENGITTNAVILAEGIAGQPTHVTFSGNHFGTEGGTITNGINIQTNGTGNPDYLSIVGNEFGAVTNPIITDITSSQRFLWTIGPNEGIDDLCPSVASANSIILPGAASCIHVTGTTTIQNVYPTWDNRKVTLIADSGLSLTTGGATLGFCAANTTLLPAGAAYLQFNAASACWMTGTEGTGSSTSLTCAQVATNATITSAGCYVVTNTGVTVTLGTFSTYGLVTIIDGTYAPNPNETIDGTVNGNTNYAMNNPGEAVDLLWYPASSTWVIK